ncbi:cold shock and DUF1294 domain-containing protein [Salinibacterium sp. ZJ450]|uniref:DUF1294 domain-containing protein n=1 Tax=Salinibacterium sp. ZJ450 TaxID=2708338 RepID=UPI001CD7020F|nr:cold shock and DUF1294 domain-containing protein [Salinibacterium sp. ZJ450]
MASGTTQTRGTLASWNDERGFGFITPEDGSAAIFVHATAFASRAERPRTGESLRFVVESGADGKRRASRVVRAGGAGSGAGSGAGHTASAPAAAGPRAATGRAHSTSGRPSRPGHPSASTPAGRRGRGPVNVIALSAIAAFAVLYFVTDVLWSVPWWFAAVYLIASVLSVVVYAADKSAATAGNWRISESTLLSIGLLGGWPGAIIAQQLLRHKTKKASFRLAFWGTVMLNVVAFVLLASPLTPPLSAVPALFG